MKKFHRGNPKEFKLAKTLKEAGLGNGKVAEVLGKSRPTIARWVKYPTWEKYSESLIKPSPSLSMTATTSTSPKSDVELVAHDFESEVILRLDKIEKMLSEKKVVW